MKKLLQVLLSLLLCACMLPFGALAAETPAAHTLPERFTFTPDETGLYALTFSGYDTGAVAPPPVFRGKVMTDLMLKSTVTLNGKTVLPTDCNTYALEAGRTYTFDLRPADPEFSGEGAHWNVSVTKAALSPLQPGKTFKAADEWYSFTPAQDGDYTFTTSGTDVFFELYAPGAQDGDWVAYGSDRQAWYAKSVSLAVAIPRYNEGVLQYQDALQKLDTAKQNLDRNMARLDELKDLAAQTHAQLDAYNALMQQAKQLGVVNEDGTVNPFKELAYLQVLSSARGYGITTLPSNYREFPDYALGEIRRLETLCAEYDSLLANAEQQLKEYNEGVAKVEEAGRQLAQAKEEIERGSAEIEALKTQVQSDADAILAQPVRNDTGLALIHAEWLAESGSSCTLSLKANTRYIVHYLSILPPEVQVQRNIGGFVDVPSGVYYTAAVEWAVEAGITKGVDATHFAPLRDCTRGEIVTFLWRAMGMPAAKITNNPFTDVRPGSYCYDAVLWAAGEGIAKGVTQTTFAPNQKCTRAHAVTFLWRAKGMPAPANGTTSFVDVKPNAFYTQAVLWAVGAKITNGTGAAHFRPDANCSRAQIVTFLFRDQHSA